MEFAANHFMLIIIIIGIAVFAFKLKSLLAKAKKIDSQGIETDAVVSRVGRDLGNEVSSSSYYTYVTYKDEHGETRESVMSMASEAEYEEGQEIVIKYMPGEYDLVRFVRNR